MASTFFFYQENSQKIIAKWRRGSKGSIFDIFDVSSTKNDELPAIMVQAALKSNAACTTMTGHTEG